MGNSKSASLITPSVLNKLIQNRAEFNKNYRLLEANTASITKDDQTKYESGHIPNAISFDTMHGIQVTQLYPRGLPTKSDFESYVGSLGISNNHSVIIYDRSEFGFMPSARTWFIFKLFGHENVSILSSGLNGWNANKFSVDTEIPSFGEILKKREEYKATENRSLLRNFDQVVKNIDSKEEQLVDVRPKDDFNSINPDTNKPNNIPNSINVPFGEIFDKNSGTIKDKNELKATLMQHGVDLSKPIIFSCRTSMTASGLFFGAYTLELKNISLYSGSWTEFSQRYQKE